MQVDSIGPAPLYVTAHAPPSKLRRGREIIETATTGQGTFEAKTVQNSQFWRIYSRGTCQLNEIMLSRETIEKYRRMSISERLALTFQAIDENEHALVEGPPEVVARRFALLRRENELGTINMLTAIARTRKDQ